MLIHLQYNVPLAWLLSLLACVVRVPAGFWLVTCAVCSEALSLRPPLQPRRSSITHFVLIAHTNQLQIVGE